MPSTAPESSYTVSAPFALEAVEVLLHRALSATTRSTPTSACSLPGASMARRRSWRG